MNKRGVYFTVLSIAFVSVLFLLYTYRLPQEQREASFVQETRIFTMNELVNDIKDDAGRMLEVATFRAIVAIEDRIAANGTYIDDVSAEFQNLILNATLEGINQSVMENNTYPIWRARIINISQDVGVALTLTAGNFSIQHVDPWTVAGMVNLTIYALDPVINASWNVTYEINGSVDLEAFEDPVYRLGTAGRVTNLIHQTEISDFVSGGSVSELLRHTNNTWYRSWTGAPSFLQRLEGKLTNSSPYGIESLVNLQELSDNGVSTSSKSIVDYIYFSSANPSSCTVNGTPSWFRMDGSYNAESSVRHPHYYEVESLINGCLS